MQRFGLRHRIGNGREVGRRVGARAVILVVRAPGRCRLRLGRRGRFLVPGEDSATRQQQDQGISLLPEFPGFGPTRKALQSNAGHTGVTLHLIDAGVDTGPIIAQNKVGIAPYDTVETLGRRQFEAAVPLAIQAVRLAERGSLRSFSDTDGDIEAFARAFCERL